MIMKIRRLIGQWFHKEEGATAIEFSLLLWPYLLISLGTIEISLMMASASLLESATDRASRMVKTGQLQQSGGDPEELFRQELCQYAVVLIDCDAMVLESTPMDSYNDFSGPTLDGDGNLVSGGFDIGGSNTRVMIRVAYRYSMVTPIVGTLINGADGGTQFISTIVLQSEPYEFQGS